MIVNDILNRAGRSLSDPTHVRWTQDELVDYINDGQRQIVLLVPDANSRTESFLLAEGSKQELPAEGIRLLRITRNMGDDGETPGRVVYPTIRSALDAENPNWHTDTGTSVQHYIYDPDSNRKVFYVYPNCTGYVEIVYSSAPAQLQTDPIDANETLELSDHYINPILDWVLYRCWAKDAEYAGNLQRAQKCLEDFYRQLPIKKQVGDSVDPTRRVRNAEIELR